MRLIRHRPWPYPSLHTAECSFFPAGFVGCWANVGNLKSIAWVGSTVTAICGSVPRRARWNLTLLKHASKSPETSECSLASLAFCSVLVRWNLTNHAVALGDAQLPDAQLGTQQGQCFPRNRPKGHVGHEVTAPNGVAERLIVASSRPRVAVSVSLSLTSSPLTDGSLSKSLCIQNTSLLATTSSRNPDHEE